MKNKGFTLVELLAVIVVLSIISAIVVLRVMDVYNDRTVIDYDNLKDLIEENTKTMVETSHTMADKIDKSINTTGNESNACLLDYQVLVNNNYMDNDLKNPITKEPLTGYIKITLNRENFKYSYEFIDVLGEEEDSIPSCVVSNTTSAITFNSAGGTGGQTASVTATNGQVMPAISTTAPTKSGYSFKGWYDAETGGTQYYSSTGQSVRLWDKTDENITLYARWAQCRSVQMVEYLNYYTTSSSSYCSGSSNVTYGGNTYQILEEHI